MGLIGTTSSERQQGGSRPGAAKAVAACAALGAVVGGVAGASPAGATEPEDRWGTHWGQIATAGDCGRTTNSTGDVVRIWQAILWADGRLGWTSSIDGDFGATTRTATIAFQNAHGLTPDGCVGPQTWNAAQYGGDGGVAHMANQGTQTYCEGTAWCAETTTWKYSDGYQNRAIAMYFNTQCGPNWRVNIPDHGTARVRHHGGC